MEQPYDPGVTSSVPNLPPFSEKQPSDQQPSPASEPAPPAITVQLQLDVPDSAMLSQGSGAKPLQHTNIIPPTEPINEPDYLWYSIFTMFCCCLPLGLAALCYSLGTMDANRTGNSTEARWNSKMAKNLATSALGFGIVLIVFSSVILAWLYTKGPAL